LIKKDFFKKREGKGIPNLIVNNENIEPNILNLVKTFNKKNFKTRASCEGHIFFKENLTLMPYIWFESDEKTIKNFNNGFRKLDLNLIWNIEANFDEEENILFTIRVININFLSINFFNFKKKEKDFNFKKIKDFEIIENYLKNNF